MAEYLTNTTDLTKVASAIREKGGTSDPLVYPDGFVTAIQAIQTGGSSTPGTPGDITFYDYDGTIVTSWTLAELATKTALPDYPSHNGLICQGWNWSLANAKTYVAKYGKLNIGQMYITDDDKTRIYIHLEEGRTSPVLGVCPNGTVDIDWGDGTTHDTLTGSDTSTAVYTSAHSYAAPGDYVIQLTVTGSMAFRNGGPLMYASKSDNRNKMYVNAIRKVELGSGVTSIGNYAFQNCSNMSSITIPDGVTSIDGYAFQNCSNMSSITIPDGVTSIDGYTFQNCYNLSSITIPDGVTSIGNYAFSYCYNMSSITIPDGVTSIGNYAFQNCYNLSSITIPDGVTSISSNAFQNCYSLSSITIPDGVISIDGAAFSYCYSLSSITIPGGVTSISSSVFNGCHSLSSITIPGGVTSIGNSAFSYCYSLSSITIPDGVTSIDGYAFRSCSSLSSITIPDGVTSIGSSVFEGCRSLSSITIPYGVTSISSNAFQNCYGVAHLYFLPTTPPSVSKSNAFSGIPTDCVIHVPVGSLSAYTSATNYPSSSTYTYVEDIV